MAASSGEAVGATPPLAPGWAPARALARRAFRDGRTRTVAFAYLFAIYAYIQPVGYRSAYPNAADRLDFAHSFAGNDALRLFYGYPFDPLTVSGYTAWRVGGTLAIAAAIFGVLAAVRALRAEEDSGRMELVLAGPLGRRPAFAAAMAACGAGVALLWAAEFVGFLVGGLAPGGSAYLALATASVALVFLAVGAVLSQVAPSRRVALELGSAVVAVALLLRVVADTATGAAWVRWATPLGWAEEMRPLTGARPAVVILPLLACAALLALAARIASRRDVGTGLLHPAETAPPRLRLLSSPTAEALRTERPSLAAWALGIGAFAFVLGTISSSVSSAGISASIRREIARLGSGSIATPSGYISLVFIFFVLAISAFACAQVGAARRQEADEQLETLLALPVARTRWLGGRLALAALAATVLALLAGLLTWAGAATQGVGLSLAEMLGAGANCLPTALLFLGIAALAYAALPRAAAGIAYGLLAVSFLWQLVGSLLGGPDWLVELTPFAHVGLIPNQPFRAGAAAIMVALGALAALAALALFRRRDLTGA